jgi:MFS family permease
LPTALLTFVAGHAADRYDRKRVVRICQTVQGLTSAFLAWGSFDGWLNVQEIYAAVAVFGTATAFESPAESALLPAIVPDGLLQKATAISTGSWQVAIVSGPALGGIGLCPVAGGALYDHGGVLADGRPAIASIAIDRVAADKEPATLAVRCSRASASCGAARRSWAPFRSTCSRSCSAARPR